MNSSFYDDHIRCRRSALARAARLCSPADDIMSQVTSPQFSGYLSQSFAPGQNNSFTNSPLVAPSSLPLLGPWDQNPPQSQNQINSHPRNISFCSFEIINTQQVYPSVVVNGIIRNVNDVIREIIIHRPPAQMIMDDKEISIICPFSYVPITCPVRGENCHHSQCFDAAEYLILQESDIWFCPICNIPICIDSLRFDPLFFKDKSSRQCGTPIIQPTTQTNTDGWDDYESFSHNFDYGQY
ncbi:MIZ zinc finger family protein [Tritrichomonas foetus]|uniref:MIZ zinc finger family protein n=1 Tax=Tritrichomonas foetus TaxID=1144522 RepID=A0A1J4L2X7_9EUKA|nr:MIZ zinc finger family protein [Tritrichomonas foetus]|eukprot:OHT16302.1 MIZ zinc finger family protein [Tritrichomonas foetus]